MSGLRIFGLVYGWDFGFFSLFCADRGLHRSLFLGFIVRSFYRLSLVTTACTCESRQLECVDGRLTDI